MSLFDRWEDILDDLRALGRYRSLIPPSGIDLTSNDYLGYAGGRHVATDTSLPRSGAASRLLRGHQPIWDDVEASLARWHGCQATLMMTSGYTANEGLLATVIEPGDWVASDALNHASIIDGLRLTQAERFVYRHNELDHLERGLRQVSAQRPVGRQLFIVTEALFGMEGDRTPLAELVELAERHDAQVVVDEAHSTGCFGPGGSGCVDEAGLRDRVLATVHTGGKALGVVGAYVCGSKQLRELMINSCRHFIYTTALPPAIASWWLEMLPRVQADHAGRAALHEHARLFRTALINRGVALDGDAYVTSLVLGSDVRAVQAAKQLQAAGFDIRAIRPPTVPVGKARLRVSIHADHAPDILQAAAAAIAGVMNG
jgi:8-amino-7-oxononanoate synthase